MARPLTIVIRPNTDGSWIGGAIYFRNLIQSILASAGNKSRDVRIVIAYEDRGKLPACDSIFPPEFERAFVRDFDAADAAPEERRPLRERGLEPSMIRRALRFRQMLRSLKADFLFPYMPQFEGEIDCPFASWIPDLQHAFLPEFFESSDIELRDEKYSHAAKYADAVVLSSESAREDFLGRYESPRGELEVLRFYTLPDPAWYEGDRIAVRQEYHIPEFYFMVCNQLWAHKNHEAVIEAMSILKKAGKEPTVVFTGGLIDNRKPGMLDRFLQSAAKAGVREQCVVLGMLPRIEQIQLLRGAASVIQPSFFEGWSTVVEDCRSLGKKLLVSDLRVHREQNVPGSVFWNPDCPDELAARMAEIIAASADPYSGEAEAEARAQAETNALECGERFLSLAERLAEM